MTVTRYRHRDPRRDLEVQNQIIRGALYHMGGARFRPITAAPVNDLLDFLPADLREGVIVETAPSEDHFAVRDLLVEFYKAQGAYRDVILAGGEDRLGHFNLAMAAYRAGKADCDCGDYE